MVILVCAVGDCPWRIDIALGTHAGRPPTSKPQSLAQERTEIIRQGWSEIGDGRDAVIVRAQRDKWD